VKSQGGIKNGPCLFLADFSLFIFLFFCGQIKYRINLPKIHDSILKIDKINRNVPLVVIGVWIGKCLGNKNFQP
jgi:hypothetical protein